MPYTQADLLKLIHDTHAVSIWNHDKGPVFWYAANVPGPFYVNTEMVIGESLSEKLLREITAIVAGTIDTQTRAEQLNHLILSAYKSNPSWQRLIATMIERAHTDFPPHAYTLISGGERRDFLFSIPFAYAQDLPHLFLFKDKSSYCEQHIHAGQHVLHVSDLINNAASFFDRWQPAFDSLSLKCCGNLCINVRGENGLRRLREAGLKTSSLVTIDIAFFRHLHAADLINQATSEEISIFFASAQAWAEKYLIGKPELFNAQGCDAKSFGRLKTFIHEDPWKLRPQHEAFFTNMQREIDQRLARTG